MSVFRCSGCGYVEAFSGYRPARCPECGRPAGAGPDQSSSSNLLIWLGVGGLVRFLFVVFGVAIAGYLAYQAGRSATAGMMAKVTPPTNPSDALIALQDPSLFRVELALSYLKSVPADPAFQPQIAAELERH